MENNSRTKKSHFQFYKMIILRTHVLQNWYINLLFYTFRINYKNISKTHFVAFIQYLGWLVFNTLISYENSLQILTLTVYFVYTRSSLKNLFSRIATELIPKIYFDIKSSLYKLAFLYLRNLSIIIYSMIN